MISNAEKTPFYLLRIELKHARRPIWREIEAPADLDLGWLHHVIQAAMGWTNSHLHEFRFKERRFSDPEFGIEGAVGAPVEDESEYAVEELLRRARQKLEYEYDFGDGWEHDVILIKRLGEKPQSALRCVAGEGACPLEDCGGAWGHDSVCAFLSGEETGSDLSYLEEWIPEGYDPDAFALGSANEALAMVAADLERAERRLEELGAHVEDARLAAALGGGFLPGSGAPDDAADLPEDMDEVGELDDAPKEPDHPYAGADEAARAVYRSVLDEGLALREAEPWKDLRDQDIFCIQDPDSGLVDIVSALGAGGEVFALHLHRGREGLDFWRRALLGDLPNDPDGYIRLLNLLEIEFANKTQLDQPDLDLYDLTGLPSPPRGRKRWMRLRRHRPRQPGWFHPPEELPQLRRALRLARRFVELLRQSPDRADFFNRAWGSDHKLPSTLPGFRLKPGAAPDAVESWEFGQLEIDWSQAAADPQPYEPSEHELARLEALPVVKERWEAGAIFLDGVMARSGPVVPIVAVVMPLVEGAQLPEPFLSDDPAVDASRAVWTALSRHAFEREALPERIQVATELAKRTFEPLSRLGVQVVLADRFERLEGLLRMLSRL